MCWLGVSHLMTLVISFILFFTDLMLKPVEQAHGTFAPLFVSQLT